MEFLTSKKAVLSILGVSSIVLASTVRDMKSNAVTQNNSLDKEEIINERSVASEEAPSKVAQLYLPVNSENIKKINTNWEISRIIGSDEKAIFDKFQNQEDSKKTIRVKMELIGNGVVRIDGDNQQIYRASILTDFGTIALFKKMGNGYEIIEAKKVVKKIANNLETTNTEIDLVLERALNQAKSSKVLVGSDVSGQFTLNGTNISNFQVKLHNGNGEDQTIEIDSADIMDGGAFKSEISGEEVSGVLFNNGKDGYRVSFVTGPMAGAMLNFVTKAQMENIQDKEDSSSREAVEQGASMEETAPVQVAQVQNQVVEERKVSAENLPEGQALSVDEIKQTAQENGFAF